MSDLVRVGVEALRERTAELFAAMGLPSEDARTVAEMLVEADLMGISSHGVSNYIRLIYRPGLRDGRIEARPRITVVRDGPTMALLDGGGGMGQVVATRAMDLAIEKARQSGVGVVAVRGSRHYGAAGVYSRRALEHDMIGVSLTNADQLVLPLGGSESRFGTNPLALAVPAGEEPPFLLDMATSTVPLGRILLAARAGESIPHGWAADSEGRSTDDPDAAFRAMRLLPLGSTLEMGGHKGMGLAMAVDILSGLLSAAGVGIDDHLGTQVGHLFAALRIDGLRDLGEFKAEMDAFLRRVRETPATHPGTPVIYAGIKEHEARRDRRRRGIPLHPEVVAYLDDLATELGVAGRRLTESGGAT